MHWLQTAPLWLIGAAFILLLLGAQQLGYVGHRLRARGASDQAPDGAAAIIPAALTLLSLLMAFTFATANERYNTRRNLVVREANAIMTAYLRVQTLTPTHARPINEAMLGYLDARQAFDRAGEDPQKAAAAARRSEQWQLRIWGLIVESARTDETPVRSGLVTAVNEMFDMALERESAQDARVPQPVVRSLVIVSVVVATLLGDALGGGARRIGISLGFFVVLALALTLILDLDRSDSGRIKVNLEPMNGTIDLIRRMEAESRSPIDRPGS